MLKCSNLRCLVKDYLLLTLLMSSRKKKRNRDGEAIEVSHSLALEEEDAVESSEPEDSIALEDDDDVDEHGMTAEEWQLVRTHPGYSCKNTHKHTHDD